MDIIQICSGITCGKVYNGELYTQSVQKLIFLYMSTDCFVKFSLCSSGYWCVCLQPRFPCEFRGLYKLHHWYWNTLFYSLISCGKNSALENIYYYYLNSECHSCLIRMSHGQKENLTKIRQWSNLITSSLLADDCSYSEVMTGSVFKTQYYCVSFFKDFLPLGVRDI